MFLFVDDIQLLNILVKWLNVYFHGTHENGTPILICCDLLNEKSFACMVKGSE